MNGYAFAAGLETALLADIRIAAENAEFGALERSLEHRRRRRASPRGYRLSWASGRRWS